MSELESQRWRRIDELFDAALELPGEARDQLLAKECAGDGDLRHAVERLLILEAEAESFLDPDAEATKTPVEDPLIGVSIGAYRLIRPLGQGGMGTVYLARREEDFRKEVAIKLVRRSLFGAEARRRLEAERQALARLEHPNIARLYDGGTTSEGLPFLVMEHVAGSRIDHYCDEQRLDLRARLRLVGSLLGAVGHAHDHLRVHCDIKPANILVTQEGVPKLLDFGIAKLLSAEENADYTATATGARPMTVGYASPEQILGQSLTTASDLYSVGVLLAELLCGRPPYGTTGSGPIELPRRIVEQTPLAPSRLVADLGSQPRDADESDSLELVAQHRSATPRELQAKLRGDLDAIVLKSIRKEPKQRYRSAEAFAEDISRHLEARPVLARSGTWRYRLGRFLHRLVLHPDTQRRHERWTWGLSLFLLIGLAALVVVWQRPAPLCQDSATRFREVWNPERRDAARRAFIGSELPFAETAWRRVEAALDLYKEAWVGTDQEICEATLERGERSPRLLDLGRLCLDGRRQEAASLIDLFINADRAVVIEAVSVVRQLRAPETCNDPGELATRSLPPTAPSTRRQIQLTRGVVEGQYVRFLMQQPVDFEALAEAERSIRGIGDRALLARTLYVRGQAETYEGADPEAGVARLEEALLAAIEGGDRPQQTTIYAGLIRILAQQLGQLERAAFWQDFAEASLAALSEKYTDVAIEVHEAIGILGWSRGDQDLMREHYQAALEIAEEAGAPIQRIRMISQRGLIADDPEPYFRKAIALAEQELGADHVRLASPLVNLGAARARAGDFSQAFELARRANHLLSATYGEGHSETAYPLTLMGQLLIALDRPAEAVEPTRQALELVIEGFGPESMITRDVRVTLAESLLLDGQVQEALEQLRPVESTVPETIQPGHPSRLNFLRVFGNAQRQAGHLDKALEVHRDLLANLDQQRSQTPHLAVGSLLAVAQTWMARGDLDQARPLLEEALQAVRETSPLMRSRIRFELSRCLAAADPERATQLLVQAKEGLVGDLELHRQLIRQIDARL